MDWEDVKNWTKEEKASNVLLGNVAGVSFVKGYPDNIYVLMQAFVDNNMLPLDANIVRNPDNIYDSNACEVWTGERFLGHLPREIAAIVAPKLDSGAEISLKLVSIGFANGDRTKPGVRFQLKFEEVDGITTCVTTVN